MDGEVGTRRCFFTHSRCVSESTVNSFKKQQTNIAK